MAKKKIKFNEKLMEQALDDLEFESGTEDLAKKLMELDMMPPPKGMKEKIVCLMLKCYELSKAVADFEIKMDKMQEELHKTLQAVFDEYSKEEKAKTSYVKC
jgi:hypothetical protein